MTENEIKETLVNALVTLFEVDPNEITLDTNLYEDLEIDSIDAIDLIDHIKKQTGYKLQAESFRSVRTVNDVIIAITKLSNEN